MQEKKSKYPPIDPSNDEMMVGLNLRPPLRVIFSFSKSEQDKRDIKKHKQSYHKLKTNKKMFEDSLNYILGAFANCKLPNWGSFIFH